MGDKDTTIDEASYKYLTFTIDTESYGIEIQSVMQIIGIQDITYIAEQDEYVKGVINLRGQIIPVIEVRVKFKKDIIQFFQFQFDQMCHLIFPPL